MAHPRAGLRIPDRHRDAFRWLAELDDDKEAAIRSALEGVAPTTSSTRLADRVLKHVEVAPEKLRGILTALYSIRIAAEAFQVPLERMIAEVADNAAEGGLGVTSKTRDAFLARLNRLLDPELPLSVGAHAVSVLTETGHTYVGSRVVSDIRPTFKYDDPSKPTSAAILHTLRIEAHVGHGGVQHEDFYFTLAVEDVRELIQHLERALVKHEALSRLVSNAGLDLLQTDDQ